MYDDYYGTGLCEIRYSYIFILLFSIEYKRLFQYIPQLRINENQLLFTIIVGS